MCYATHSQFLQSGSQPGQLCAEYVAQNPLECSRVHLQMYQCESVLKKIKHLKAIGLKAPCNGYQAKSTTFSERGDWKRPSASSDSFIFLKLYSVTHCHDIAGLVLTSQYASVYFSLIWNNELLSQYRNKINWMLRKQHYHKGWINVPHFISLNISLYFCQQIQFSISHCWFCRLTCIVHKHYMVFISSLYHMDSSKPDICNRSTGPKADRTKIQVFGLVKEILLFIWNMPIYQFWIFISVFALYLTWPNVVLFVVTLGRDPRNIVGAKLGQRSELAGNCPGKCIWRRTEKAWMNCEALWFLREVKHWKISLISEVELES